MPEDPSNSSPGLTEGVRRVGRSTSAGGLRRHRRVALRTQVQIHQDGDVYDGRTEDISEGGMLVASRAPLALGDTVELDVRLPGHDVLHLKGEVRRLRPSNRHALLDPGVGIMFVDLNEEAIAALSDFIMRRIKAILFRDLRSGG